MQNLKNHEMKHELKIYYHHNKWQSSSLVGITGPFSFVSTCITRLNHYASKLVYVLQSTDSESEGTKSQHCRGYSNAINISYLDDNVFHSSNINTDNMPNTIPDQLHSRDNDGRSR